MENNIEKNNDKVAKEIVAEEPISEVDAVVQNTKSTTKFPAWIIPTVAAVVIALLMVILIPTFLNNKTPDPVYKDYIVTVVDGAGSPMSNVIVKFTTPDGEVKTRVTEKDGIASLKNVLAGNYLVKIERGFSNAVVDVSEYTLTEDVSQLYLSYRDESNSIEIYGDIAEGLYGTLINAGSFDIPFASAKTSYLVFSAVTSGVYKVSVSSDDSDIKVGFYGIPMFVQSEHCGDGEYDGKSFEIVVNDTSTPYVIGITSAKETMAHLTVERTGDAPFDPQFAPWTVIPAPQDLEKCTLPTSAILSDIDVTSPTVSVELGDDGYYYTADGKLVYLRIGSVCDARYLDVSIAFIAGLVDENFGQNFGGYIYDENGEFEGKYSYNEMLAKYYENCNGSGLYPLTEELAEAIKCHGESSGWWRPNTANYLFNGVAVNHENAWLFLCCTAN